MKVRFACVAVIAVGVLMGLAGCAGGSGMTPQESASSQGAAEKAEHAAREAMLFACMEVWLRTEAPRSVIDDGFIPLTDGQSPAQPALVLDDDGVPHLNLIEDNGEFAMGPYVGTWAARNRVPVIRMKQSILDGKGCPYYDDA